MKKSIIEFIVKAIEDWEDNTYLGEEIRMLEDTLNELMDTEPNQVYASILLLIIITKTDEKLGEHMRVHYPSFKLYLEDAE